MQKSTVKNRKKSTKTAKSRSPSSRVLRKVPSHRLSLILTSVLVVMFYMGWLVISGNMNAHAQTPLPVQTFQSTYSSFTPGSKASLPSAQRCTTNETIYGARPTAAGSYPVLIYLHGSYADTKGNIEGQRFVQLAAAQGFVAVSPTYKSSLTNTLDGYTGHAYCMFDQSHPGSSLAAVCTLSGVDCSKGVAVAGFSQGAAISVISKNYNPLVTAGWAIGLSATIYPSYKVPSNAIVSPGGTRALPNNKLVINMGQTSNIFTKNLNAADLPSLKTLTGVDCGTSFNCLQSTGQGYYVVQNSEVSDKVADHCYWEGNNGCTLSPDQLEVGFQPPATTSWSMIRNLDWLRTQLSL